MTTKNTKQTIRQGLRSALAKAAQDYALELHRQWGMEVTPDDYWIGGAEEPAGAPYQLRTCYFISLDEMQYIIDHGILRDEYDEYYDYCQRLAALSLDPPTFREWREHPDSRYADAALERLQTMKDDLEREADRLKQSQQPSAAPAPESPRPVSTLLRGDERLWDVALRGIGISMPDEYVMRLVRLAQKVHAFGLPSIHLDDLTEIEMETSEEVRKRVAEAKLQKGGVSV